MGPRLVQLTNLSVNPAQQVREGLDPSLVKRLPRNEEEKAVFAVHILSLLLLSFFSYKRNVLFIPWTISANWTLP